MNSISEQLKQNFTQRHPKPNDTPPNNNAQDKFMQLFETINKVNITNNNINLESHEEKFQNTLAEYSSKSSHIDSIINSEDLINILPHSEKITIAPLVPNLKPKSYDQIQIIREIFEGREVKENIEILSNTLLVVEQFSDLLMQIGRRNKAHENKLLAKSKAIIKEPSHHQLSMKEIQTDPREFQSLNRSSSFRTKRKDLILMQLLSEKKRKPFSSDYFQSMQMKLMQFLDFILGDEKEYIGLEPELKIKTVLNNLEHFQGKIIEGESKINLLRIFFEEFTSLKKEKDQLEVMRTPVKIIENKEKMATASTKVKHTDNSSTPLRKMTNKKEVNFGPSTNKKSRKPSKIQKSDEWIGSL